MNEILDSLLSYLGLSTAGTDPNEILKRILEAISQNEEVNLACVLATFTDSIFAQRIHVRSDIFGNFPSFFSLSDEYLCPLMVHLVSELFQELLLVLPTPTPFPPPAIIKCWIRPLINFCFSNAFFVSRQKIPLQHFLEEK